MAQADAASQPLQAGDKAFSPRTSPQRSLAPVHSSNSSDGLALLLAAANDTTETGTGSCRRGDSAQAILQHASRYTSPSPSAHRPASSSSFLVASGLNDAGVLSSPSHADGVRQQPVAMIAAPFHGYQADLKVFGMQTSRNKFCHGSSASQPSQAPATTPSAASSAARSASSSSSSTSSMRFHGSVPAATISPATSTVMASPPAMPATSTQQSHPVHPRPAHFVPAGIVAPQARLSASPSATLTGPGTLLSVSSGQGRGATPPSMGPPASSPLAGSLFSGPARRNTTPQHQLQHQHLAQSPRPAWSGDSRPLPGGAGTVTPVFLVTLTGSTRQHILHAAEFETLLSDLRAAADAAPSSAPLPAAVAAAALWASASGRAQLGLSETSPPRHAGLVPARAGGSVAAAFQSGGAALRGGRGGAWQAGNGKNTPGTARAWRGEGQVWRLQASTPATQQAQRHGPAQMTGRQSQDGRGSRPHKRPRGRQEADGGVVEEGGELGRGRAWGSGAHGEASGRFGDVDPDAVGVLGEGDDNGEEYATGEVGREGEWRRRRGRRGSRSRPHAEGHTSGGEHDDEDDDDGDDGYAPRPSRATRHGVAKSARQSRAAASAVSAGMLAASSTSASSSALAGSSFTGSAAGAGRTGRQRTGEYITSTFRGVYGRSSAKASGVRWAAHASDGKRKVHLGYFNSAEEAARAYDEAVLRFKGPTAITNFRYDSAAKRTEA